MKHNSCYRRSQRGIMLIIAAFLVVLVAAIIAATMLFGSTCTRNQSAGSAADAAALQLANVINSDDQVGRMNNLIAQSRDLVYCSRHEYDQTLDNNYSNMEPLARHLLGDARWGSQLVDYGRKQLFLQRVSELSSAATHNQILKEAGLQVMDLEVGQPPESTCNVYDHADDSLQGEDERNRFCDRKSKVFAACVDAKLPGDDGDLSFKLSPLPAPAKNIAQPGSLIHEIKPLYPGNIIRDGWITRLSKVEINARPLYLPCAIKLHVRPISMNQLQSQMPDIYSTACTNGGQPMP